MTGQDSFACRFCKELLPPDALYCTHCNRSQDRLFIRCKFCKHEIPIGATHCIHCGRSQSLVLLSCEFCREEIPSNAHYCPHCNRCVKSTANRCKFCMEELPIGATHCAYCARSQNLLLVSCPFCQGAISKEATYCIHCNRDTTWHLGRCRFCKKEIPEGATYCTYCNRQQKGFFGYLPVSSSILSLIAIVVSVSSTLITIVPTGLRSWEDAHGKSEIQCSLIRWGDTDVQIAVSNKGNRPAAVRGLQLIAGSNLGINFAAPAPVPIVPPGTFQIVSFASTAGIENPTVSKPLPSLKEIRHRSRSLVLLIVPFASEANNITCGNWSTYE
jgi:double zinc ribbon protein